MDVEGVIVAFDILDLYQMVICTSHLRESSEHLVIHFFHKRGETIQIQRIHNV